MFNITGIKIKGALFMNNNRECTCTINNYFFILPSWRKRSISIVSCLFFLIRLHDDILQKRLQPVLYKTLPALREIQTKAHFPLYFHCKKENGYSITT